MLKNQTVNHVSEHLSAICPVYTSWERARVWDEGAFRPMSCLFVILSAAKDLNIEGKDRSMHSA